MVIFTIYLKLLFSKRAFAANPLKAAAAGFDIGDASGLTDAIVPEAVTLMEELAATFYGAFAAFARFVVSCHDAIISKHEHHLQKFKNDLMLI